MLSLAAAIGFLAAVSMLGVVILRHVARFLTVLELVAYGPVLGTVVGSILVLGLATPIGLLPAVVVVTLFSLVGAVLYWPRGATGTTVPRDLLSRLRDGLGWLPAIVIGLFVVRLALLWSSALTLEPDGLWAGHLYIWSDWTVHLGDTASFAFADNFPPMHPRLAGAPLAYHYLTSLTAAGMVALGVDLLVALPLQSFLFSVLLLIALYAFALRLTGDRTIATLALVLFMLGGSLGWVTLFENGGLGGALETLATQPWDTGAQVEANYQWPNPYFALIMSQRAALYGVPVLMLVLTILLVAIEGRDWRQFALAGLIASSLPLAHLGSFAGLALVAPFLVLLFPQRGWLAFLGVWVLVGGAVFLGVQGGEARASSGLRWEPGWLADDDPWPWFWAKNFGLFLPFGLVALFVPRLLPRASHRLLLAFMPIFVVINTFILSVVRWDNSKVLLFFFIALAILAATAVVALWRLQRDVLSRAVIVAALATMIASGTLANASQLMGLDRTRLATPSDLALADWVNAEAPPDAVFAVGLEHNDPVPVLTGRQIITSYLPWLRNIGLDSRPQEADLRAIFLLEPDAPELLDRYGVDYIVIGPWEERELGADPDAFADRFPLVATVGEYRVFAVSDRARATVLEPAG